MHIYTNEVTDWIIAADEADANAVLREHYGYTQAQLEEEGAHVRKQWPDDKLLRVHDDDGVKRELLPAEWIAREGRGFLCSTEY